MRDTESRGHVSHSVPLGELLLRRHGLHSLTGTRPTHTTQEPNSKKHQKHEKKNTKNTTTYIVRSVLILQGAKLDTGTTYQVRYNTQNTYIFRYS